MWTKICANTNSADARLAADLGASAVGFVFAPSSRRVSPADARAIGADLPPSVERIGVFVTEAADEIIEAVDRANLTGVQLHSRFNADLVRNLHHATGGRVALIQVVHWDLTPGEPPPAESLRKHLRQIQQQPSIHPVLRVLIDARTGAASGGTGITFDWKAAAEVFEAELGDLPLIVAGGLRPENVREAIDQMQPWGVDVATGVESSPGNKDPRKLEAFLRKASL